MFNIVEVYAANFQKLREAKQYNRQYTSVCNIKSETLDCRAKAYKTGNILTGGWRKLFVRLREWFIVLYVTDTFFKCSSGIFFWFSRTIRVLGFFKKLEKETTGFSLECLYLERGRKGLL